jgi:hypothetical protein
MFDTKKFIFRSLFAGITIGCSNLCSVANAQFVAEEIVYENAYGEVTGQHPRAGEYGDELILARDGRKVVKFEFEYLGQFEPEGDETCVVRFYANDGEKLFEAPQPSTLLYESAPFTVFPEFNAAVLDDLDVEVPDSFTFTAEFSGFSGRSNDRVSLLLRNLISVGKSYDDFWAKSSKGWAPWRFNGDPVANFACRVTAEIDQSVKFKTLRGRSGKAPILTVKGPRDQSAIVYASNDMKEWQPIALEVLKNREFTIIDGNAEPNAPRYYRTALINSTAITLHDISVLENAKSRMSVTGPRGQPFKVQASNDFENWSDVFSFSFQTRPITVQDDKAVGNHQRFYRILLNNSVVEDPTTITETIVSYPDDFTHED